MKELFKNETKISKDIFDNIPKEAIERNVIMSFLGGLPIEKLKNLVNIKEFDFENKNLCGYTREDKYLYHLLCRLRTENIVLFKCEMYLD